MTMPSANIARVGSGSFCSSAAANPLSWFGLTKDCALCLLNDVVLISVAKTIELDECMMHNGIFEQCQECDFLEYFVAKPLDSIPQA